MCPLFEFLKFRIPGFLIIRNDEFLKMMKSRRQASSLNALAFMQPHGMDNGNTGPPQSDAGVGIGMLIGDRNYIARK